MPFGCISKCLLGENAIKFLIDLISQITSSFVDIDQSWGLAVFEAASIGIPIVLSKSVGATELLSQVDGIKVVERQSESEIADAFFDLFKNGNYSLY